MPEQPSVLASRANRTERALLLLALALYAVLLALLLARHEMWRDELQAWLLARDSDGLTALWNNSRYEGHPLLWHLLLYPLAHLFASPVAMQALHWVLAVGVAGLLLFRFPAPLWARVALVAGYLPLYEYGVLSRNYCLSVLAVFGCCAVLAARRSPALAAVAAAVAASSSPMGMLLCPALACLIWSAEAPRRTRVWAVLLVAAGALLGAFQCLPPPDYEHARGWFLDFEPWRIAYVARGFVAAPLPVPELGPHFWGRSALFPWPAEGLPSVVRASVYVTLLTAALAAVAVVLRRSRAAVAAWLLGSLALILFSYTKLPGAIRQNGFLWVLLVAVLWIARDRGALTRTAAAVTLAPVLLAGLVGSAVAAWFDWKLPFSGAACAARSIESSDLADLPLVGGVDWATSGVAAYLAHGRLYYPASRGTGSYIVWNLDRTRQADLKPEEIVSEALAQDRGAGVALLLNSQLPANLEASCRPVFACEPTIVVSESLWGYRCRAGSAAPPPAATPAGSPAGGSGPSPR